ncbi:hypothetical protein R9C00_26215 [Flammeovirgaceae bacterium SG7u.111]|nr:hypothetical protein [Flammeovirgaceae bacterium SG7u.132]WPO35194.1 hypothetical protein R9C00_26215 [Flammeovirgaceae bacterium SG7u.111]
MKQVKVILVAFLAMITLVVSAQDQYSLSVKYSNVGVDSAILNGVMTLGENEANLDLIASSPTSYLYYGKYLMDNRIDIMLGNGKVLKKRYDCLARNSETGVRYNIQVNLTDEEQVDMETYGVKKVRVEWGESFKLSHTKPRFKETYRLEKMDNQLMMSMNEYKLEPIM